MPKERIIVDQSSPAPDQPSQHSIVDIGWLKEGAHVSLELLVARDDDGEVLGRLQVNTTSYVALNTVIRQLRAARDGAFGKPE